ncbi:MAG: CinA family protein, partial [Candidatus Hermodarchaeota archaeon]
SLSLIEEIIAKFTKNKITLAVAESCTGGYISNMLTNVSGASRVFERGIVCYSNSSKISLLNINPDYLIQHGAVSEIIAKHLANNIRILSNVTIGIGITGIAGPTGGKPEKPVGLVYVGFSTQKETLVKKFQFHADRIRFKEEVLKAVIELLQNFA